MSEPSERARRAQRIAPYTLHWSVSDDRIGGAQSDSYAMNTRSGVIFIDPLPMTHAGAEDFPSVASALLTSGCHQRSSWRYRQEHGARVWAPRGAEGLMAEPDNYYTEGSYFPADIQAIRTPGPEFNLYAFLRPGEPSPLFVGDLIRRRDSSSPLEFFPAETQQNPAQTRESVEKLLDLEFDLLCLTHGGYIDDDPKGALRELLERTA